MIIGGLGPLLVGLTIAGILVLLPLPPVTTLGTPTAWCGPGKTSSNAIAILLDPSSVNIGSAGQTDEQLYSFEQYCVGEARDRAIQAGVSLAAAAFLGIGIVGIITLAAPRQSAYGWVR
jgi:hypothetical protein